MEVIVKCVSATEADEQVSLREVHVDKDGKEEVKYHLCMRKVYRAKFVPVSSEGAQAWAEVSSLEVGSAEEGKQYRLTVVPDEQKATTKPAKSAKATETGKAASDA